MTLPTPERIKALVEVFAEADIDQPNQQSTVLVLAEELRDASKVLADWLRLVTHAPTCKRCGGPMLMLDGEWECHNVAPASSPTPSAQAKCDHMGRTVNCNLGDVFGTCTWCGGRVEFPNFPFVQATPEEKAAIDEAAREPVHSTGGFMVRDGALPSEVRADAAQAIEAYKRGEFHPLPSFNDSQRARPAQASICACGHAKRPDMPRCLNCIECGRDAPPSAQASEYAGYTIENVPTYYVADNGELRPYENHGLPGDELLCKYSDVRGFVDGRAPVSAQAREALEQINVAACYATEEDPGAAAEALLHIGDMARTALRSLSVGGVEVDSQWRDIATAPRDSTPIMFWCPEVKQQAAVFFNVHEDEWQVLHGRGRELFEVATLWRPLPAAPVSA